MEERQSPLQKRTISWEKFIFIVLDLSNLGFNCCAFCDSFVLLVPLCIIIASALSLSTCLQSFNLSCSSCFFLPFLVVSQNQFRLPPLSVSDSCVIPSFPLPFFIPNSPLPFLPFHCSFPFSILHALPYASLHYFI